MNKVRNGTTITLCFVMSEGGEGGKPLTRRIEVVELWKKHFKNLLNEKEKVGKGAGNRRGLKIGVRREKINTVTERKERMDILNRMKEM